MEKYVKPSVEVLGTIAELTNQIDPRRARGNDRYFGGNFIDSDAGSRDLDYP